MKTFLSAADIARLETVSAMTATRWVLKGYFPNARKVGTKYRVPLADYDAWRKSTQLTPEPVRPRGRSSVRTPNNSSKI